MRERFHTTKTIIDRTVAAMRAGNGTQTIEEAVGALVAYGEIHFAAEEALMDTLDFPDAKEHKAHHDEFRQWLGTLKEDDYAKAGERKVAEISVYLGNWFHDHILNVDKDYEEFFQRRMDDVSSLLANYEGVPLPPENG